MLRLFVAIRPPREMRDACLAAIADLPPGWAGQDEQQLHLTLRYIGEVERPVAEDIAAALETLRALAPEVALSGVGWFDQHPRGALFARAEPREPLAALHKKVDRLMASLGLAPERRSYLPHITLARRRSGAHDPGKWLERRAALTTPPSPITHVSLYESHLGHAGVHYEQILVHPLC